MNSHIANLFLAISRTLTALTDGEGNKYFRFIDQEYGQLEWHNGDNRPPVTWPCILIDVDNVAYQNMSELAQTGMVTVVLRLGFPPFSGTSNITPSTYQQKALYYYDLEQVIYLALHGKQPVLLSEPADEEETPVNLLADVFGSFTRISARTEQREDHIRVRTITYTIALEDYTATPGTITVSPVVPSFTLSIDA